MCWHVRESWRWVTHCGSCGARMEGGGPAIEWECKFCGHVTRFEWLESERFYRESIQAAI